MRFLLAIILSAVPMFGAVFNDGTRAKNNNSGALATAVGNLDSDDADEFVSISSSGAAEHFEIHDYVDGAWVRHEVLTSGEVGAKQDRFGTEIALADIDDDGDLDIAVIDSSDGGLAGELLWYENPGSLAGDWDEHSVTTWSGSGAGNLITHSEVAAGDINADGMIDLVGRDVSHGFWVLIQDAPGDGSTWETRKFVATNPREGIALADIDEDGDLDIVINGVWYATPADPVSGTYTQYTYGANWYPDGASGEQINDFACQVRVADFDLDGDLDIAITNAEELSNGSTTTGKPTGARLYLCPANPLTDSWTEVNLYVSAEFSLHSLEVGDFDKDGDLDVITGVSEVGVDNAAANIVLLKNDGDGTSFTVEQIDSGTESGTTVYMYQASVGDFDGDGDLDLFAPNNWNSGPIWTYENATPWILPEERYAPWRGNVGVYGGIPDSSGFVVSSTITDTNATAATINAAIQAASSNQVVVLGPGTFANITARLVGKNGVVLRGSGMTNTILAPVHNNYGGAIYVGTSSYFFAAMGATPNYNGGASVNWTAGYTQGSSNITLASTSGLAVGNIIVLDQLDDPSFVNTVGYEGENNAGRGPGLRALQQQSRVMAIDGTTVTIWPPVALPIWDASFDPEAWWIPANLWMARFGIEDMTIDGIGLGGGDPYRANIYFETAKDCWIKNVKSLYPTISHVNTFGAIGIEIRSSVFIGTESAMSLSYGILPTFASWVLIEDNAFEGIVVPVMAGSSSSLSVAAYNYNTNHYYAGANNWLMPSFAGHDAHCYGWLYEGNHGTRMVGDFIHGSGSHNVFFRNRLTGLDPTSYPDGNPTTQNRQVFELQLTNYFWSSIGNIYGTDGIYSNYEDVPGARLADPVIYDLGIKNGGYPITSNWTDDTQVLATFYRHMDFDFATDGITYNSTNSNRTLPNSLYLASAPSFFGEMPWPPYNPTNTTTAQMSYTNLPAGLRFIGEGEEEGGGETGAATINVNALRIGTIQVAP